MGTGSSTLWNQGGRHARGPHEEFSEVSERLVAMGRSEFGPPQSSQQIAPQETLGALPWSAEQTSTMSEVMTGMYLSVMVGYDLVGASSGQLVLPFLEVDELGINSMCPRLIVNGTAFFELKQGHRGAIGQEARLDEDDHPNIWFVNGSVRSLGADCSVDFEWADRRVLIAMRNWLELNGVKRDPPPFAPALATSYRVKSLRHATNLMSSRAGSAFFGSAESVRLEQLMVYVPLVEKGNSQPSPEGGRLGDACKHRLATREHIHRAPEHYVVSFNNVMSVLAPTKNVVIGAERTAISGIIRSLNLARLARGAGRKFLMSISVLTFIKQITTSRLTESLDCSDLEVVLALCACWEGDVGIDLVCDLRSMVNEGDMHINFRDCHWSVVQGLRFLAVCARSMVNGMCGCLWISRGADITSNLSATELMTPDIIEKRGAHAAAALAEQLFQALENVSLLTSALTKSMNLETKGSVVTASLDIREVYSVLHTLTGVQRDASDESDPVGVIVGTAETLASGAPVVIEVVLGALREGRQKPHLRFVISQVDDRRFRNLRTSDVADCRRLSAKHLGGDVERTVEDYSDTDFYVGLSAVVAVSALGSLLSTGVFHFLYALLLGAVLGEETDGFLFVAGVAPMVLRRARVPSGAWLRAAYIVMLGSIEAWAELEVGGLRWAIIVVGAVSTGVLIACRVGRSRLVRWGSGCARRADFFRDRAGGPTPGVGRGPVFAGTRCGDGSDPCVAPYACGTSRSDRIACEHAPAVQEPFDLHGWRLFGNATEARTFRAEARDVSTELPKSSLC